MDTFERAPGFIRDAVLAAWGWIAAHWAWTILILLMLLGVAFALDVIRRLIEALVREIRYQRLTHRTIEQIYEDRERRARQRERQASARAQELLDAHPDYRGLQIATMTPAAYHYVRDQLTAEGLWS